MIINDYINAKMVIDHWKRCNCVIGFTNGVFDLFHAGHTRLLIKAKNMVDKLVVGINSDMSTKIIKGQKRPIINEEQRCIIVDTHKSVDLVIMFEESTPFKLMEIIEPNLWIKGIDWVNKIPILSPKKQVPIQFIDFEIDISTTKIIEKIQKKFPNNKLCPLHRKNLS